MKKHVLVALALALSLVCMAACGKKEEAPAGNDAVVEEDAAGEDATVEEDTDAAADEEAAPALTGELTDDYTKTQTYDGVLGGTGETVNITAYANDDISKIYITFDAFGEAQIVEGTIADGMVSVGYDKSGFMGADAQGFYEAADPNGWVARDGGAAAAEPGTLTDEYTKTQTYDGVLGGTGETVNITAYANDDLSKIYITFNAFGEDQIVECEIVDGMASVLYDKSGFMGADAQGFYEAADPAAWVAR